MNNFEQTEKKSQGTSVPKEEWVKNNVKFLRQLTLA